MIVKTLRTFVSSSRFHTTLPAQPSSVAWTCRQQSRVFCSLIESDKMGIMQICVAIVRSSPLCCRDRERRGRGLSTGTVTCRSTRGNNGCWPPGELSLVDTRSRDRQLTSDWSRIKGAPAEDNFRLQEEDVPELRKGEILCRALYISVDPITRCVSA